MARLVAYLALCSVGFANGKGILFPQESETRELKSLDGIWNFRISPKNDPDLGFREEWFKRPLSETGKVIQMPVPSSYNDITQEKEIRDHIGWAWYNREFWLPKQWVSPQQRISLRFGGVNYHAIVWINGVKVAEHAGGHLPFAAELDVANLSAQKTNRLTVAINNTLNHDTVPQGTISRPAGQRYPPGYFTLNYNFDFFNYAGIHRPVYLYTTPQSYIDDISVTTEVEPDGTGMILYDIEAVKATLVAQLHNDVGYAPNVHQDELSIAVRLEDKTGATVAAGTGGMGFLSVPNATLWWPFSMVKRDEDAGYLYTLVVSLQNSVKVDVDVYRLKVGIRSLRWDNSSFSINGKPFYFRGFGRHEDFNVRGRGIDNVMIVKDHNLIKWVGANSYRTSHYPYSEEIMDICDELGIVIIDEISAVAISGFGEKLLETHKQQLRELVQRDKNRASVVMWSVSNEPQSQQDAAGPYFKEVFELAKILDSHRPITIVLNTGYSDDKALDQSRPVTVVVAQDFSVDKAAGYADIICINRYYSWYSDTGHTEVITASMVQDVHNWINKFKKPVIVAEYGADTVAGLHSSPEFVFTEEYQLELLREHYKAYDQLRTSTSFIGEMIWNFADFMTAQGITRIVGNRKGIFTRERQPKASAHLVRTRYHLLAQEYDSYPFPADLPQPVPIYTRRRGSPRHDEV